MSSFPTAPYAVLSVYGLNHIVVALVVLSALLYLGLLAVHRMNPLNPVKDSPPSSSTTAPLQRPNTQPDIPLDGVKLSYIVSEFYANFGGKLTFSGLTTTQVKETIIVPSTEAHRCSYCELLQSQHHPAVGRAQVFISHAWAYKFIDLIDALQNYFKDDPDIIIWLDIFSINQIVRSELTDLWYDTFKYAIKTLGCTVMVLAPWRDPIPLKRGWCLYELYCTIVTGGKFGVAMSACSTQDFIDDICEDVGAVNRMLSMINVKKSECSKKEDKEKILSIIESSVGFSKVNSLIFEILRDWVITTTDRSRGSDSDQIAYLKLTSALANLYKDQGKNDKAESLITECLEKRKTILSDDHPDALTTMNNLGNVYRSQGNYDEAVDMYTICLEKREAILGDDHPDTLKTMHNLAVVYYCQGEYDEAMAMYTICLEKRRSILGDDHPDTLMSMNNLALVYLSQGDYEKAVDMYTGCLKRREAILGDDHPRTLTTMSNLANVYRSQGKYDEAVDMYTVCLERYRSALGDDHPDTLTTMNNLAVVYKSQGKRNEAVDMYTICLEKREAILGDDHPDTLKTMHHLAAEYYYQGEYDKAMAMYTICLAKRKSILGDDHPDTLTTMNNLAAVYKSQGKRNEAVDMYTVCLEKRLTILGDDHPDTLITAKSLARLRRALGNKCCVLC